MKTFSEYNEEEAQLDYIMRWFLENQGLEDDGSFDYEQARYSANGLSGEPWYEKLTFTPDSMSFGGVEITF